MCVEKLKRRRCENTVVMQCLPCRSGVSALFKNHYCNSVNKSGNPNSVFVLLIITAICKSGVQRGAVLITLSVLTSAKTTCKVQGSALLQLLGHRQTQKQRKLAKNFCFKSIWISGQVSFPSRSVVLHLALEPTYYFHQGRCAVTHSWKRSLLQ